MRDAVVVLSGGQDSTTCLFYAVKKYKTVHAVTFDYGQRHRAELGAAWTVAQLAGVADRHETIVVPDILKGTSPLVNKDATLEQYPDWQHLPGGLEKTFVPMRNQFFLTVAANRAICENIDVLVTGVCQEDFGGYPDCRLSFINSLARTVALGTALNEDDAFGQFEIDTPLMELTKAESVDLALALPGCYGALGFSHTSYDGAYPPTGKDHATLLRAKGFEQAGVPDPLIVRAYWEGLMKLPETDNYVQFAERIRLNSPWLGQHPVPHAISPSPDYATNVAARLELVVHAK